MERILKAFENANEDGGVAARSEYKTLLAQVKITNLPPRQRPGFQRRLDKATKAVERDMREA